MEIVRRLTPHVASPDGEMTMSRRRNLQRLRHRIVGERVRLFKISQVRTVRWQARHMAAKLCSTEFLVNKIDRAGCNGE
jgi:hypothetical protein